ncbi:LPS export ABC transporter permease LptG [Amphiplicatus metriothermophilus]|uniref:Lipopolysaccharide export system permease protein n=1 Tax=Amphiplicatus metriothermophilus TaxID=1519374 RepID=A0A239PXZ0_9PROT|nr:LPS export ABC transporter permease LptG [Amphiplicatus metriothermophilus]MBB5519791.1 lipopolysaccharide export system permease protein [Amphiplicatus metriothermophilus]SNT75181.1 lipopolysaccharide export system permease protein [Amphiplicatus metriothermophilus]
MPPATLLRYIAGRVVFAVAALFAVLASCVMLVELVENLRFASKFEEADLLTAARITLLRTPSLMTALAPFVFLFASIWMFSQLNRRAEIAVMRAAGLSVWRLIGPAALVAALSGLVLIAFVDPLASRLRAQSESLKDSVRGQTSSLVEIFGDGLWLRQRDGNSVLLINARGYDEEQAALSDVTVWRLDGQARFLERIDAPGAMLSGRTIELHGARIKGVQDQLDHRTPIYAIPTSLTPEDLGSRIEAPETLSLWRLPRFILLAEAAGLSTTRYNMRFHDLCSTPLKLIAMVLIAAMFSLKPIRSGGAAQLFLAAVAAGFLLYLLSELSAALGESGAAPVALAAWTPALAATLFALAGLLHFEES